MNAIPTRRIGLHSFFRLAHYDAIQGMDLQDLAYDALDVISADTSKM